MIDKNFLESNNIELDKEKLRKKIEFDLNNKEEKIAYDPVESRNRIE
jgi:hypothetical protein